MFAPKIRQTIYAVGTIATALLSILSVWRIIDPVTSSSISAALGAVLGLLGAGAAGTAAVVTGKQIHNGTFDEKPDPSPADLVVNGVQAVLDAKAQAERELQRVQVAISEAVAEVPVLGPLASQVLDQLKK